MKILYFTKYSRKGASSRLRSFQYIPFLEQEGHVVEVQSLFGDHYLSNLYKGVGRIRFVFEAYLKRAFSIIFVWKYDVLIIEKELFPYLPGWIEQLFSLSGVKYIADYDDAIFHNYDMSENKLIRYLLSNKIDVVMRNSFHIVAGNPYLKERAISAGATKISVIPTVIDLSRYPIKNYTSGPKIVVGWIGTKSTFDKHYQTFMPVVEDLAERTDIEFHVIGADLKSNIYKNLKFFEWSEDKEVEMIHRFDIGIMPLTDSAWEQGKCSYKLIQYMAAGIPVVCSPVGMNKEVVQEGRNGYHATSSQEWKDAICKLVDNEKQRIEFGRYGRELVEQTYNLNHSVKQLLLVLSENRK